MGDKAEVVCQELAAFNARDWRQIRASFSPDCLKEVPGAHLRGGDQVAAWCSALWEAFPDIRVTVAATAEVESIVIIEGRVAGTHQGPLRTPNGDILPTRRRADLPFSEHAEVQDGVIVSARLYFDRLELLEQLGLAAVPARV
jgi:ketosteroid isomerase-like protein